MKRIISTFLLALLTGCIPTADGVREIDRGTFVNQVYQNEFFGFSLPVPDSWDTDEIKGELLAQFDTVLDDFMADYEKEEEIREGQSPIYYVLLSSTLPRPDSAPAHEISYLIAYAVDLSRLRGVDGAADYLRHFKGRYPQSSAIEIGDVISGELGGREFGAISTNVSGVRRMEYATAVDEYALVFSIVYERDEQLSEVRRVLDKVLFDRDK